MSCSGPNGIGIAQLANGKLLAVEQFISDGSPVAAEFRRLDQNLIVHATVIFAASGGLMSLVVVLSFRQLERMQSVT